MSDDLRERERHAHADAGFDRLPRRARAEDQVSSSIAGNA